DITFGYWRLIPLPEEVELRLNARTIIPTAFNSQKQSVITTPSLAARVTRVFFDDLVVNARVRGTYYFMKYATAEGGNPNSRFTFSFGVDTEYQLPAWRPLSFGAELFVGYRWFYQIPNQGPGLGSSSGDFFGATTDPQFGTS